MLLASWSLDLAMALATSELTRRWLWQGQFALVAVHSVVVCDQKRIDTSAASGVCNTDGRFSTMSPDAWRLRPHEKTQMTYEEYLDEVTTLLTELYDLEDAMAIKLVMDAQEAEFFSRHDDLPALCTEEQAKLDAVTLFEQKQNKVQTQKKQQQRVRAKK